MNVYSDLNFLPIFNNAVVTVGSFDGVHLGHQQILKKLLAEARSINGKAVVITFHPHPRQITDNNKDIRILNELFEKVLLLQEAGIDELVVVPFDKSFSELTAEEYIRDFLVKRFHPKKIVIGYDHRFGNNRSGDYRLLQKESPALGYAVIEIREEIIREVAVSSTKIRKALLAGNPEEAAEYLGYEYFLTGVVVQGNKLGRTIGFPTANLEVESPEKLIPADGVYAVDAISKGRIFQGMMNIGMRPTVDGKKRVTEVNIFDFDEDIYGTKLTVILKRRLRSEIKFSGIEALKEQLSKDRENSKLVL